MRCSYQELPATMMYLNAHHKNNLLQKDIESIELIWNKTIFRRELVSLLS